MTRKGLQHWCYGFLWLGMVLIVCQPVLAQLSSAKLNPTVPVIEDRIKQLEANPGTNSNRTKSIETYRLALIQLQQAEEWTQKAQAFLREQQAAPQILQALQKELDSPLPSLNYALSNQPTTDELDQVLTKATTDLNSNQDVVNELARKLIALSERRRLLPGLMMEAKSRVGKIKTELATRPLDGGDDQNTALRYLNAATEKAILAEVEALEDELAGLDQAEKIAKLRYDLEARKITQLEQQIKSWREKLTTSRQTEAELTLQQTQADLQKVVEVHPGLRSLAEVNVALASLRTGPTSVVVASEQTKHTLDQLKQKRELLTADFDRLVSRVATTGLTNSVGMLLLRKRAELPTIPQLEKNIQLRQSLISSVQTQLFECSEQTLPTTDIEPLVQVTLLKLDPLPARQQPAIEAAIRNLFLTRSRLLEQVTDDYSSYFDELVSLDSEERGLILDTRRYLDYINENVLWVRGVPPLKADDLFKAASTIRSNLNSQFWKHEAGIVWKGFLQDPLTSLFILAGIGLLLFVQTFLGRKIRLGEQDSVAWCFNTPFADIVGLYFLVFLNALIWPVIMFSVALRLNLFAQGSPVSTKLSLGIGAIVGPLFLCQLIRNYACKSGLGETHLGWLPEWSALIRAQMRRMIVVVLPAFFLAAAFGMNSIEVSDDTLGRLPFLVALIVLATSLYQIFRPAELPAETETDPGKWEVWKSWLLCWGVVSLPLLIGLIAILGFTYTAWNLSRKAEATVAVVLFFSILRALLRTWSSQRRLEKPSCDAPSTPPQERSVKPEEAQVSPLILTDQIYNLVQAVAVFGAVVVVGYIWFEFFPIFKTLNRIELWSYTEPISQTLTASDGSQTSKMVELRNPTTVLDVIIALAIAVVTYGAVQNIPTLLKLALLNKLPLDAGVKYAISAVTSYVLTLVGVIFSLSQIGITWSKVQWLAAAFSVGLGFGLQEIFANFVSGIILLFERPMRVGDIITVGSVTGTVTRIGARATFVLDFDRKELVIPNKTFITGQLVNWTLSDDIIRIQIPVNVAYGSNVELVETLLLQTVTEVPDILNDPPPRVIFTNFADSHRQ
ncbi:MAG: mechanosensitive ion channel [Acidobacteria bacterium]|nr:mechanosensitive ion channel [Acidobacteriota bacterium]